MNLAIIPARANSKRIKNKNILNFLGKPMIQWSILAAKKTKIFDGHLLLAFFFLLFCYSSVVVG